MKSLISPLCGIILTRKTMVQITKIERQKGLGQRTSIYLDDEFFVGLSAAAVKRLDLRAGMEVDEVLRTAIHTSAIRETALMSLARREHSRTELRRKLGQKRYPKELIQRVLDTLEQENSLNDRRFAEAWIERRRLYHPRGRRLLMTELKQKGVDDQIARDAVAELYPEDDEETALIALIKKRLKLGDRGDADAFRRRLLGFLARRGFAYDDIRRVLNEHFPDF